MSDLIEHLIELSEMKFNDEPAASLVDYIGEAVEVIQSLKAQIEELKAASKWIPVSERLPEEPNQVYVWYSYSNGCTGTASLFQGEFNDHKYVTHWKPITPPEGKDDE